MPGTILIMMFFLFGTVESTGVPDTGTGPGAVSSATVLTTACEQDPAALIVQGRGLLAEGVNRRERDRIEQAREVFEQLMAAGDNAQLGHYYLGLAGYRLANLGPEEDRRTIRRHINAAIDHLETAVELDPDSAESLALLGGAYGIKIAVYPLTAMTLGPKNQRVRERARELAPDNPRVVLLDAISYFNTPGAFGGDKEKALELALHSADLFTAEEVDDPRLPRWGREEVWAWIGIIQTDAGRDEEARAAYERALEINPDYSWVRDVLLPDLPPGT